MYHGRNPEAIMIVRESQILALQALPDRDFHRRALRYIQLRYPQFTEALDEKAIEQMVNNGIARARGHGLSWESTLVRYVELMFSIAPNFDQLPQIRSKLRDEFVPPEERLNLVVEQTSYDEWREVTRAYDPMAWGVDPVVAPEILELRGEVRL
jgi:hypothetical protein